MSRENAVAADAVEAEADQEEDRAYDGGRG
jgi:hypothetical protein